MISIEVEREVNGDTFRYIIQLEAHLKAPTEAKDGNKYKVTIPFSVNKENGIKIIRQIEIA